MGASGIEVERESALTGGFPRQGDQAGSQVTGKVMSQLDDYLSVDARLNFNKWERLDVWLDLLMLLSLSSFGIFLLIFVVRLIYGV